MVVTADVKPAPPTPTPDSACSGSVRGGAAGDEVRKGNIDHHYEDYETRRTREARKAERIMHLIWWGPK
ncbi:UNVERIFIED_CONTAM: hypothetical protein Sradi_6117100 [Sesamum radiatum]|uniref:Uncharacterized protein n=1 Tax=Sesamum radiatum TaxID=300843 RepID=A0AAW2KMV6_SESRA